METVLHFDAILDAEIFRGRRSVVHRGHYRTGERIVVKLLREARPSPRRVAWARREYELIRSLAHIEGVVRPMGFGMIGEAVGLVTEDIGGASLAELTKNSRLPLEEILRLSVRAATTLDGIHKAGVIHKDINPSNIVYNRGTGQMRIIDFGIATSLPEEDVPLDDARAAEGTLAYVSPEQTGRMNRRVDQRTDLYAMGVTLYQLVTGRLPFQATDPLELMHAHLARVPAPPHEVDASVPAGLSAVIVRLLAKDADHRYSSAGSLAADLQTAADLLRDKGTIPPFPLDHVRRGAKLRLPQRLIGRDADLAVVVRAFDAAAAGPMQVLWVGGYSGVGKSALVQEMHRPITERRGLWGSGKFDQYQRSVAFSALAQAFREVVRQLLGNTNAAAWGQRLREALGPNGRLVVELVPELGHLIGPTPEVPALPPAEAQRRAEHTLGRFVGALADEKHPLVLFIDDLQWIDPASLALLEALLVRSTTRHLLFVGAYRDNEVPAGHPLALLIGQLDGARQVAVSRVELKPLTLPDVEIFVNESLDAPAQKARALAALVAAKTQGNPFFMREFMKALVSEGLLTSTDAGWKWNVDHISKMGITDNVVELMAGKLLGLPQTTRDVLRVAGALGAEFDLAGLALTIDLSARDAWMALWPAMSSGAIVALDEAWKLVGLEVEGLAETLEVRFRFSHDRVQQAAYTLTPETELPRLHARIGERLLAGLGTGESLGSELFRAIGHLNLGRAATSLSAVELARLELTAARRAKGAAGFAAARDYALVGLELLGQAPFVHDHGLALALVEIATETAYQTGDFPLMERMFAIGVENARSALDAAWLHEIRIESFNASGRPLDALLHALETLEALGVSCPREPGMAEVGAELAAAAEALAGRSHDALAAMPDIEDPATRTAVALICKVYSSAYVASPFVFLVLTLRQVRLVMTHGNCAVSPLAYAVYGLILAGVVGDVRAGYAFGQLSDRLLTRPDVARYRAQALHLFSCHTRFWSEHLRRSADGEREAWRVGLETGELEFGCYGGHVASKYAFFYGESLTTLLPEIAQYTEAMGRLKNALALSSHVSWHQAARNLVESSAEPWRLAGPVLDVASARPVWEAAGNRMALSNALTARLFLSVVFERWEEASQLADEGATVLDSVLSQFNQPLHHFLSGLARLGAVGAGQASLELLAKVDEDLAKLRTWADAAPVNFAQKVALLDAERARVTGDDAAATKAYDIAAELAEANGFVTDEALACEAAARHHAAAGRRRQARHALRDAHESYVLWGATTKVSWLEAAHAELAPLLPGDEIAATTTTSTTGWRARGSLDLASVLKASQAISSEVVLPQLLKRLVATLMENAGADRVVILLERGGDLAIEATAEGDAEALTLDGRLIGPDTDVAVSVVNYVARTGEALVLDDAAKSPEFGRDPWFERGSARSVLCQALFSSGRLRGVVYLENRSAPGVFDKNRTELVGLLASQIATSVDHARLYANLEERVAERTARLEARNTFIRKVFGRYMSDDIVDAVLESDQALDLGGERRTVTVLFADIRGFTTLCERLNAEQVVQLLNLYLSAVTAVVRRWHGTLDNIIADGVLVLFGAPFMREDDPERAVACAVDLQQAILEVNERTAALDLPAIEVGIGVHTGEVIVGNIGSAERAKYSVIGSTVNLAARIEATTPGGQISITDATRAAIRVPVELAGERSFLPKGFGEEVTVYSIRGIGGRFGRALD